MQEAFFGAERKAFLTNARGNEFIQFPLDMLLTIAKALTYSGVFVKTHLYLSGRALEGYQAAGKMSLALSRTQRKPLSSLRFLCDKQRTTDPRDKIFALVGMHKAAAGFSEIPELVRPDYTRSTALVYRDASRYMLMEDGGLHGDYLLAEIFHVDEDLACQDMPSWAFDFLGGEPFKGTCLTLDDFMAGIQPQKQTNRETPTLRPYGVDTPEILQIQGFTIGTVVRVHDIVTETDLHKIETLRRIVCETAAAVLLFSRTAPARTTNEDQSIAELLTCCRSASDVSPEQRLKGFKALQHFVLEKGVVPLHSWRRGPPEPGDVVAGEEFSASHFHLLMRGVELRRLAVCSSGHVGFLPMITRVGDLCVIAEGAHYPFILREYPDGYRFVGVAYLQELMHGQVYGMGLESKPMMIL